MSASLWALPALALLLMAGRRWLVPEGPAPRVAPPDAALRGGAWLLAGLLVAAFALRLYLANAYPARWSEIGEIDRALSIFDRLGDGRDASFQGRIHAPLQPIVAHLWIRLCELLGIETSLAVVRIPSALFGTLIVFLAARLGARLASPLAGLAAATLVAFSPQSLLVGVSQEYYVVEHAGLLFFIERCAAYLLGGAVHRSLAFAAAAALWAGYLNGLVIVPALPFLLVAATRRGDLWGAGYAMVLAALLLAPLFPTLYDGVRTYLAINPGAAIGDHDDTGHPVLDPASYFAQGSFAHGLGRLAHSLLGHAGFLFIVGAALLALRAPLAAVALAALPLAYAFVGTRIAMSLYNYGGVFAPLFVMLTAGIARLPWLGLRRLYEALALGLVVAAALVAAHVAWPLFSAQSADDIFNYWDPAPFDAALAEAPKTRPVLLLVQAPDALEHRLCAGQGGVRAWTTCARRHATLRGVLRSASIEGRVVTQLRPEGRSYDALKGVLPGLVQELVAVPPWSREGFLVVREAPRPPGPIISPEELDRWLDGRCEKRATMGLYTLLRCPPLPPAKL